MGEIGPDVADVRDVGDVGDGGEDDRMGFRIFRFSGRGLGRPLAWTLVIGMSPYYSSTISTNAVLFEGRPRGLTHRHYSFPMPPCS